MSANREAIGRDVVRTQLRAQGSIAFKLPGNAGVRRCSNDNCGADAHFEFALGMISHDSCENPDCQVAAKAKVVDFFATRILANQGWAHAAIPRRG
jgi:hypothetical protein